MAEKSLYRRAVEYLQAPPQRVGVKSTQPITGFDSASTSNFGFNTQSGFFPKKLIDDMGDGVGNSAVVACLQVLATAFAEAPLKVYKKNKDGREEILSHDMEILMQRPNEFISGSVLSHYLVTSLSAHGDAFLMKVRNKANKVVQLIPLMPNYVKVRGNEKELITHYEYHAVSKKLSMGDEYIEIPRENVVHIRQGVDPDDHRRGFSPLQSVLRELAGDEAAGQFAVALLHNMAVPGVILSPKDDSMGGPTREEADAIAQSFKSKFAGSNRGAPMIMTGAMDIETVSFTPEQLNLTSLRRLPEERVSAVLGVPAILAGLGAGLDAATYNNTRELREFFTEQKMIPLWRSVADELTHQLLHMDFEGNDYTYECSYDLDMVRALSTDRQELIKTMNSGVQGGFVTIGEARRALGLDADNSHDIYLRPLNLNPVAEGDTGIVVEVPKEEPVPNPDKATLGAGTSNNFPPQVRRSRIKKKPKKKKNVAIDITMEFKSAEVPIESAEDAKISKKIKVILEGKVIQHNATNPKYRITYRTVEQVFSRGVKAHGESPVEARNSVSSSSQWGLSRVNSFIKGLQGEFPRDDFDLDLFPKLTDFPKKEDNLKVILKNSNYPQFSDYSYVKEIQDNYPSLWKRSDGNISFTRWTEYRQGTENAKITKWVKAREKFLAENQDAIAFKGVLQVMKRGGITKYGEKHMKGVIDSAKRKEDTRNEKSSKLLTNIDNKNKVK